MSKLPHSDLQAATESVIKLSSDTASIMSIIHAADYGSQLYQQAKIINEEMNQIAYDAERGKLNLARIEEAEEAIHKLATLIADKKSNNPLISDDLVSMSAQTAEYAEKAVALTKIALNINPMTTPYKEWKTAMDQIESIQSDQLKSAARYLLDEKHKVTFFGKPWSKVESNWIYFDTILNLELLTQKFSLNENFEIHENNDPKSGQERGFIDKLTGEGLMGRLQ